jgi:hypothetical protein
MKNSAMDQSGIKSSVRRSISIFLVFATLAGSNVVEAAGSKNMSSHDGTNVQLVDASDRGGPASPVSELAPLSVAQQPALWCYTSYGRFPMLVALPPGYSCSVSLAYYPYFVTGITGY